MELCGEDVARDIVASVVLRHPVEELNSGLPCPGWQLLGVGHSSPKTQCLMWLWPHSATEGPPFLSPRTCWVTAEPQQEGKKPPGVPPFEQPAAEPCWAALARCSVLCTKETSF